MPSRARRLSRQTRQKIRDGETKPEPAPQQQVEPSKKTPAEPQTKPPAKKASS